jgi:hypothetical protein
MRLTLRTLLAYMDDILEPADAQDIDNKIQESEFATGLLHRTRDVMRRMRLSAPDVWNDGETLNCNTVAEYLDNTLSNERVPDFERICLESDVHLAEVACCHQILTLVLGEPAEVDPMSRQRMYQVPSLEAAEAEAAGKGSGSAAAVRSREKPTVPDYLREQPSKRPWMPAVAGVLLTVFFAVVVLAALGQFEPGAPLASLLGIEPEADEQVAAAGAEAGDESPAPQQPAPEAGAPEDPAADGGSGEPAVGGDGPKPDVPAPSEDEAASEPEPADGSPAEASEIAAEPPMPSEALPEEAEPTEPESTPQEPAVAAGGDEPTAPMPVEPNEPVGRETPADAPATIDTTRPGGESETAEAAAPATDDDSPPMPSDVRPPVDSIAASEPKPGAEAPEVEASEPESTAPATENLGRVVSDRKVLVGLDAESGAWNRVPSNAILTSQKPLLALPTYRPGIALTGGLTAQLAGGTQIELLPKGDNGSPGVVVRYGRIIVRSMGQAEAGLRFRSGDREGQLTLLDAESTAAVEVTREVPPGVDPTEEPVPPTIRVYAVSGQVRCQAEGLDEAVTIESSKMLVLPSEGLPEVLQSETIPDWAEGDTTGALDQRASPAIEAAVVEDRPVELSLRELSVHRQREVRWLAVRCLGHLGEFRPLVAMLDDGSQKVLWPQCVRHVRDALERGPEAAAQLKAALENEHPEEGSAMYRILLGYSDQQFRDGGAARLIDYLDHSTLAVRVVAFLTLEELTGLGLYYEPGDSATKRAGSIRKWKERLESGELFQQVSGVPPGGSEAEDTEDESEDAGQDNGESDASAPAPPLPEDVR